jgi:hypothetical protein
MSLQNVRWFSKDYVVLCLRRRNSSWPWPKILHCLNNVQHCNQFLKND